jgi:quinol monooxygenase YgiN
MYAVVVNIKVDPVERMRFLPLIRQCAAATLRTEEDCIQLDVCTTSRRPNDVLLYGLYTDRAAFDLHLNTPHFRVFDAATTPMVLEKDVTTFEQVSQ